MSRPDRPYRATVVGHDCTFHYDYPTKEKRADAWATSEVAIRTTVTSRKPVKPGTPVCWVNVFRSGGTASHRTKEFADCCDGLDRTHCIPVYLPGEGAEPVTEQMREAAVGYYLQHQKDRQRMGELESEVERLKTALTETMAQRDAALTESAQLRAKAELRENQLQSALNATKAHKAEVERLTKERDALLAANAEISRQRDAAQARAMPAGKVVYGMRETFPDGTYVECTYTDRFHRDETFPLSRGYTWFVRIEEGQ